MLRLSFLIALCGIATGCARDAPPTADSAQLDEMLARFAAQENSARMPAEKVSRAERFVAPLEKVQPDKINPEFAVAMIAG